MIALARLLACVLLLLGTGYSDSVTAVEPNIQGIRLGDTRESADLSQFNFGKKLTYASGLYWYRKPTGPMDFSPMVIFGPDGRIQRITGSEVDILGSRYKAGDYPYALKLNLGLPKKDVTFVSSGCPVRELIYPEHNLVVRLRRGHQDRIEIFLLDRLVGPEPDEHFLYLKGR